MAEFYDFDRANARIPELREALLTLRSLREALVAARDRIVELNAPALAGASVAATPRPPDADQETQRLRMRMQGLVDQMQAAVLQIDGWGIPGQYYRLEISKLLDQWVEIGGMTADSYGRVRFEDEQAMEYPMRFYRFKAR